MSDFRPVPPPPPEPRRNVAAGIALLVLGLLILVPSGLCTGIMAIAGLLQSSSSLNFLPVVLIFGGPFIAAGSVLVWFGIQQLRRKVR